MVFCWEDSRSRSHGLRQMKHYHRGALLLVVLALRGFAQDTHYAPKGQLIPAPGCLIMAGAWQGGYTPCTASTHQAWLNDIRHWRSERKIRIGYTGWRYGEP